MQNAIVYYIKIFIKYIKYLKYVTIFTMHIYFCICFHENLNFHKYSRSNYEIKSFWFYDKIISIINKINHSINSFVYSHYQYKSTKWNVHIFMSSSVYIHCLCIISVICNNRRKWTTRNELHTLLKLRRINIIDGCF